MRKEGCEGGSAHKLSGPQPSSGVAVEAGGGGSLEGLGVQKGRGHGEALASALDLAGSAIGGDSQRALLWGPQGRFSSL